MSQSDFDSNTTFQKIIPYFHCEINTLYHELTHNIALILVANLEKGNFETIIIQDNDESNNLISRVIEYNENDEKQLKKIYYFG